MSRGHGAVQQQILRQLRSGRVVPVNELQWLIAGHATDISDAVANSFGRALRKLEGDDEVKIESRQLESFDEVVAVLPFRSRSLDVMRLRRRLLPHLSSFSSQRGGYGGADNERYVLEHTNELRWRNEEHWNEIERDWKSIEDGLYGLLPSKRAPHRLIVDIITRGKELFSFATGVAHPAPLGPMLKELMAAYSTKKPPAVVRRAFEFYQRLVPRADRVAARVFSKLLEIVNIARHGADTIREEAAEYLLEVAPKIVRALPGHKDGTKPFGPSSFFSSKTTFSPLLDKLLTKEALQEFRFVSAKR